MRYKFKKGNKLRKGMIPWNKNMKGYGKGRIVSQETKNKMGESKIGPKNHMWKGDKVKYQPLHAWVKRHKPKSMFCEKCGKVTSKLDLANISGEYKRDISDFRWLCRRCHMKEDGRLKAFKLLHKNIK